MRLHFLTVGSLLLFASLGARAEAGLADVRILVSSPTQAQVFWTRPSDERVEVSYNGELLGLFDSDGPLHHKLSPTAMHRFAVRSVDDATARTALLTFSTAQFTPPTREVRPDTPWYDGPEPPQSYDAPVAEAAPDDSLPSPASTLAAVAPIAPDPIQTSTGPTTEATPPSTTNAVIDTTTGPGIPPPSSVVRIAPTAQDCVVRSIADLTSCARAAAGFARINVQADLTCTNGNCCPAGGALVSLRDVEGLAIAGNGYRLLRKEGQRACSLVDIADSADITIRDWALDDDAGVPPCTVNDNCPRMLHIRNARDITLDGVSIANGKGYVVYVQQVDGFTFRNGALSNAGVLGLYVGHEDRGSTRVRIENSRFTDNATNAVALLGVYGDRPDTNRIRGNRFVRNHARGQWPVAPRYGSGLTGGGQVYIARASALTIADNLITDGRCSDCYVHAGGGTGVHGIELSRPGVASVSNVLVQGNTIRNNDGWGIYVNQGGIIDGSVRIVGNALLDNGRALSIGGAARSDNVVVDR